MDKTDTRIIAALRKNGRETVANLAASLQLSRATVRSRMERMQRTGVIQGFTVRLNTDDLADPVRGITLIKVAGNKTNRIIGQLHAIPAIQAIHSTNGKWDLIAQMATENLTSFDAALSQLRKIDGISESETNLLLATQHFSRK